MQPQDESLDFQRTLPHGGLPRGLLGRLLKPALIIAGIVLGLLLCEAAARLAFPPFRGTNWYHRDPRYTMRHRAHLDAVTNEWGDGVFWHYRTNARGFRGSDWPATPPPGVTRVLVMGDSMTFGDGVEQGGAYPDIADRLLHAAKPEGRRWRVLNLGVSAWGPQNALGYLESEGADIGAACLVYG